MADPLLPLDFFALRTPRAADLASLTVLAAPFGFSFLATLFLQRVQHHSALETGLALLPGAVLSAVGSRYAAPVLVNRLGLRASAVGGLLVVAAGFAMLLRMDPEVTYVAMMLPASIVCLGLGMGVAYPVFTLAAVTDVPDDRQRSGRGHPEHGPAGRGRLRPRRRQRRGCRRWGWHGRRRLAARRCARRDAAGALRRDRGVRGPAGDQPRAAV